MELGFDDTQTPDIAQRAKVSVGTFYRYFVDKRQVFVEVIVAYLQRAHDEVIGNVSAEAFDETRSDEERRAALDESIDVLFRHAAEFPKLHRVFIGMSLRDREIAELRARYEDLARRQLATLIAAIVPRDRVPDPLAAAEVIAVAGEEIAMATAGARGTPHSREHVLSLRRALGDMIYRYLFAAYVPLKT
jgi:AcrR family transcriptional regulator